MDNAIPYSYTFSPLLLTVAYNFRFIYCSENVVSIHRCILALRYQGFLTCLLESWIFKMALWIPWTSWKFSLVRIFISMNNLNFEASRIKSQSISHLCITILYASGSFLLMSSSSEYIFKWVLCAVCFLQWEISFPFHWEINCFECCTETVFNLIYYFFHCTFTIWSVCMSVYKILQSKSYYVFTTLWHRNMVTSLWPSWVKEWPLRLPLI